MVLLHCSKNASSDIQFWIKALSHCAMIRATCLAMALRDMSHETLHSVTYLETAENVARQVEETVAESRTVFYFLQRFRATCAVSRARYQVRTLLQCFVQLVSQIGLRDKLHSVTAPLLSPLQCGQRDRQVVMSFCSS